ncbi:sensor histidine kinase [Nonomuraea insulae]|uniref:histidine kinase n=1 Tax=Nonomuraea insulae TaxID=1616787 RepID=A0ABW1D8H7_9ACTN
MRAPRPIDAVFAALLAVTGLLEVAVSRLDFERPLATATAVFAGAAVMLVRSQRPLTCLALFVALIVVAATPVIGDGLTAAVVAGCLIALGTVGRRCRDRISIAAALATVGIFTVGLAFSPRPWDALVALIGCATAWGAGRLLRREAERNVELTALAAELVTEREARAREAVSAERARIARELHDAVAHTVSIMTVQTAGVRRRLDTDPDRRRERDVLLAVERLGREAVEELHRAVGILRAESQIDEGALLAPLPGLADLDQLAARVHAAGVPVQVRTEGSPRPLPGGLDLVAYRVVQEALTNTLKHAGPARASVLLSYGDTRLTIAVLDDGHGNEDSINHGKAGHGLAGMRERASLYGGTVEAGPDLGKGYAVRVTLPIPRAAGG